MGSKRYPPSAVKQQQFISTHIYGAVCPATGQTEALISPMLSIDMMEKHFQQISDATPSGRHAIAFKNYDDIVDQVSRGWNNFRHQVDQVKSLCKRDWANLITN